MSFEDLESGRHFCSNERQKQDLSQAVAGGVFQLNTAVASFRRLVNTLGTPRDTLQLRQKLHKTRLHIGQLVKETSAKLKQASETDRDAKVSASKKIADAKLAKDFQSVLKEFQKAQRIASERETNYAPFIPKEVFPSRYLVNFLITIIWLDLFIVASNYAPFIPKEVFPSSNTADKMEISPSRSTKQLSLLVEPKRQEVLLLDNEIVLNEAIIEEREQGIQEIQLQISEANEIFKDLAVLVHKQGVIIDDISSNIDNSNTATRQATSQLAKASETQRSNSSMTCLLLVIFGIILLIVMILVIA
ncbi:syntaxin-22-like [Cornus florida]|uniref:syntaxin-22-like n=1 Tax=Cornus florida TaxID=4283 RepID=UPI00289BFA23|nr:syntaxin-22-like [Cornus florida]